MSRLIHTATAILFLIAALLIPFNDVSAEQQNKSAKDCIENPDSCDDGKTYKTNNGNMETDSKVGVTFWDFLKMILATLFVAALLYFLLKFINKKSASYKSSQLVENLGGTSLGGNRSVQVVKVGDKLLIVGVAENIQLLSEVDDPEEYSRIIQEHNSKMEQLLQPSDIVTKLLQKVNKGEKDNSESFSNLLKNQLDDLSNGRKKFLKELQKKGSDKHE